MTASHTTPVQKIQPTLAEFARRIFRSLFTQLIDIACRKVYDFSICAVTQTLYVVHRATCRFAPLMQREKALRLEEIWHCPPRRWELICWESEQRLKCFYSVPKTCFAEQRTVVGRPWEGGLLHNTDAFPHAYAIVSITIKSD